MAVKEVLLLGSPNLYECSQPVTEKELGTLAGVIEDLHDTLMDFRKKYHAGRAIAAPQIGCMKRIIYLHIDGTSTLFINPRLSFPNDETMEIWDDCMSFPNLLVKVQRYKQCSIEYKDLNWRDQKRELEGDLSELLQHEYDHLDGILAVDRAVNNRAFLMKKSS